MNTDITKKFDDLSNLEENMRKLNQVLETSIKSSYQTRYEYNLNDYKKNFNINSYSDYQISESNFIKENNSTNINKNYLISKNQMADLENDDLDYEEENVILSKKFYAEKNNNLNKNKHHIIKSNLIDKNENFQNTLNLKNKNNFAQFEEVEKIRPTKTELNKNFIKKNFNNKYFPKENAELNHSLSPKKEIYENVIKNNPYDIDFDYNKDSLNVNKTLNVTNMYQENNFNYHSNSINYKNKNSTNSSSNFVGFNVENVLKTADNINKNKNGKDAINKRIEVPSNVYDIQKLKKVNNYSNQKDDCFDEISSSDFFSAEDKNFSKNQDNIYSESNFKNNINSNSNEKPFNLKKKDEDEFDYLKNLLMKTQMDIQNFNDEFDDKNKSLTNNKIQKNTLNSFSSNYNNINKSNNFYDQGSTQDRLPRKEPKPTKPTF